jgi:hypothetical protein
VNVSVLEKVLVFLETEREILRVKLGVGGGVFVSDSESVPDFVVVCEPVSV